MAFQQKVAAEQEVAAAKEQFNCFPKALLKNKDYRTFGTASSRQAPDHEQQQLANEPSHQTITLKDYYETATSHQEVLIFTNRRLSPKALWRKNSSNKNRSAIEEAEEAFWDGFLNELVPEIMPSTRHSKMVIWGVHAGRFCLVIDLGDSPGITELILSIDPHLLLSEINMN